MFIIYECLGCVLSAVIAATLLCTACVVLEVLKQGASILAQRSRKLTRRATHLKERWMAAESFDS